MNNKRIIYWREYPIDVEIGLYEELSKTIDNEIIFLCNNDFPKERKLVNFDYSSIKNSKTIIIDDDEKLIKEYIDDIHLFFGITGKNGKHLRKLIKMKKDVKFFIVAERPNIYGNFLEKLWCMITRFGYYRLCSLFYRKHLIVFLTMGDKGVKIYKILGFKKEILFDFMYTLKETPNVKFKKTEGTIKMLYIGRFEDKTKGLDILRNTFDKLDYDNYHLDLVGGYGKDSEKTINWAKGKKNVTYIGKWSQKDVIKNMQNYDICLVPSKYDGWNLAPNQVIDAGIGIIISDNATSDELIKYAKNGLIFKNGSKKAFNACLNKVLNDKKIIDEFKKNSLKFKRKISNKLICEYYIDVLEYALNGYVGTRPTPPWKK